VLTILEGLVALGYLILRDARTLCSGPRESARTLSVHCLSAQNRAAPCTPSRATPSRAPTQDIVPGGRDRSAHVGAFGQRHVAERSEAETLRRALREAGDDDRAAIGQSIESALAPARIVEETAEDEEEPDEYERNSPQPHKQGRLHLYDFGLPEKCEAAPYQTERNDQQIGAGEYHSATRLARPEQALARLQLRKDYLLCLSSDGRGRVTLTTS